MLLYHNRSLLRLVLQCHGSVILRLSSLFPGAIISAVTWVLAWLIRSDSPYAPSVPHHYGIHAMGSIVVFAVVFRANQAWQRYWEAMTQQHFMYSKWADAYSQFHAFATVTVTQTEAKEPTEENLARIHRVTSTMESLLKNFSLLSVFAADRLFHGDTTTMEERATKSKWTDQVVLRKELGTLRARHSATELLALPPMASIQDLSAGEPPSKLKDGTEPYTVIARPSRTEEEFLAASSDRVSAVMYWILHDLAQVSKDIDIAPPVQSRMYQELSSGMLGFSNSLKIADVPFPLPYAQLLTLALIFFSLFIPIYVAVFTEDLYASPLVAFFLFQGLWGVNEVAKELENPFGSDVNDISLLDFHERFMQALRETSVAHEVKAMRTQGRTTSAKALGLHLPVPYGFDKEEDVETKMRVSPQQPKDVSPTNGNNMYQIPEEKVQSKQDETSCGPLPRPSQLSYMTVLRTATSEDESKSPLATSRQKSCVSAESHEAPALQAHRGQDADGTASGSQSVALSAAAAGHEARVSNTTITSSVPKSLKPRIIGCTSTGGGSSSAGGSSAGSSAAGLPAATASAAATAAATSSASSAGEGAFRQKTVARQNVDDIDKRLLEIGGRMDHRLMQIAGSVDALTQAMAVVVSSSRSFSPRRNEANSSV